MTDDSLATQLAARFREDARALRARADTLATRSPAERAAGPDAAACRAMADACDRVTALFTAAPDDSALGSALSELDRLFEAERVPEARHVYAGAASRLRQALDPDDDGDHDDHDDIDESDDLDDED